MKHRVTIQDIADELKITSSTVSRALNDHPAISKATKEKVFEVAKRLNYQPNHLAAALRSGKSKNIGVVVPYMDRAFFGAIVKGIEEVVSAQGYGVIICQTNDDIAMEKRALDSLMRSRVDGVMASVAGNSVNLQYYQQIKEADVPIVYFDRVMEELSVSSVVVDDLKGGYEATKHLIEQGYRRIAHFAGDQSLNIYRERRRGYQQALMDYGLQVDPQLICECSSSIDLGKYHMERLYLGANPPDALFSSSDFAALGAMQYLRNQSLQVIRNFGIIGFANEPFTSFVEPQLSTVDQFPRDMGQIAARTLLEEINGSDEGEVFPAKKVVIQPKLIVRASSRKKVVTV